MDIIILVNIMTLYIIIKILDKMGIPNVNISNWFTAILGPPYTSGFLRSPD